MDDAKTQARGQLSEWLAHYEKLRAEADLGSQTEATVRTWTEELLRIFGWKPEDPRQVRQEYRLTEAEAHRQKHGEGGSVHNRPDYLLFVRGRPALFLETKRFSAMDHGEDHVAHQIRSYGWSKGLKLSYAFDVERLAVYDCRRPPDLFDEAGVDRLDVVSRSDYLARFDRLWDYLSRDAIEGGSLDRLFPDDKPPPGARPLDLDFEEKLSAWRRELAKVILRHGETDDAKVRDSAVVSATTQRILDRIVFLRFCEALGLEELGTLSSYANDEDGFWPPFMKAHEERYRDVYDGVLFPLREDDDKTGIEHCLRQWWLKGDVFKEITRTLYRWQYKFDEIPVELLGGIYERYLGKKLQIVGTRVDDTFKPEHQRTKGAVYTPPWIVDRVVRGALDPIALGKDPEEILGLRVLDPACGSGSFLVGALDYLEERILGWFEAHPRDARRDAFVSTAGVAPAVRSDVLRALAGNCVYGVDIDDVAVEVARMSLALRYAKRRAAELGATAPTKLLAGIGRNVRQGNALVGAEAVSKQGDLFGARDVAKLQPFVWEDPASGFGAVMGEGGFHAVVGNPPYIEVKHYRKEQPELYKFLKDGGHYQTAAQGKTDIAMPFIERSVGLLRPGGRLGFIVQNRFFKTDYGSLARGFLARGRLLESIEDFRDLQIFAGRTTYTAILVLSKGKRAFRYRCYGDVGAARREEAAVDVRIGHDEVDDGVWSFDEPDLARVHRALAGRHGTIGDCPDLSIAVGLQTLWGKVYQLAATHVGKTRVRGVNGLGEEVEVERGSVRPLCRNQGFYALRRDNADAWVIFPYAVEKGAAREILWPEFEKEFPKAAEYLAGKRRDIQKAVDHDHGRHRWHLYTRPQNLAIQARPKVLFPMTIEDTLAAVDATGEVYQDNVNVNAIVPEQEGVDLHALAAIFCSTTFSALARLKAGLNDSGWRKFNRQFAELAPFPRKRLTEARQRRLAELARQIETLQPQLRAAAGEGERSGIEGTLGALWRRLDEAVDELYALTDEERTVLARYPRKIDRVRLVLRQEGIPAGEEAGDDS